MSDDRKNLKVSRDEFDLLRAAKGSQNWGEFLTNRLRESSEHTPVFRDRGDQPLSGYVACDECGRSENNLRKLDQRPCRDSIAVNE